MNEEYKIVSSDKGNIEEIICSSCGAKAEVVGGWSGEAGRNEFEVECTSNNCTRWETYNSKEEALAAYRKATGQVVIEKLLEKLEAAEEGLEECLSRLHKILPKTQPSYKSKAVMAELNLGLGITISDVQQTLKQIRGKDE